MKFPNVWFFALISAVFVVFLSSCGGGGSSSGGGVDPAFVGTYTGSVTLTFSSPGSTVAPITETVPTTLVVNSNGTVIIDPGPEEIRGTIKGNTFTAFIPGSSLSEPGFICTGTVNITGTGNGDTFTGSVSGDLVCNGISVVVTGTFTVTRATAKALLQNTALGNEIRAAVRLAAKQ